MMSIQRQKRVFTPVGYGVRLYRVSGKKTLLGSVRQQDMDAYTNETLCCFFLCLKQQSFIRGFD